MEELWEHGYRYILRCSSARAIPCIQPHKIARDCQANEDDTVPKQSSLSTLIDLLGKHLKILILSFAKKHISSIFESSEIWYTAGIRGVSE